METYITTSDFRQKLSEFVEAVANGAGSVILTKHNKSLVAVVSMEEYKAFKEWKAAANTPEDSNS